MRSQAAVLRHRGPTVLFHRDFMAPGVDHRLDGQHHTLAHAHAAEEVNVEVADNGPFTDIDTPEDYERFIAPTLRRVERDPPYT